MKTDILIIGGGLAGLGLARHLHMAGRDCILVEARSRFGGRIKTETSQGGYFDMGPAWFWPGQPRIATLISQFELRQFDQFSLGDLMYEDENARIQRGRGHASMQGSLRLKGGLQALTDKLEASLPELSKQTGSVVKSLEKSNGNITATLASNETISAQQVVLALPTRVAAERIAFTPPLPKAALDQMRAIPTWMAGQAKAVATYDTPFWRNAGLSGDAMSRHGPMVEIHDASPHDHGPYALFGFIGVPPQSRRDEIGLRSSILAQLTRLFGPDAASPQAVYIKDWAHDPWTATGLDQAPLYAHPQYGLPPALVDLWDRTLHFGGTEVARDFGGFLEGALEAAENTLSRLDT